METVKNELVDPKLYGLEEIKASELTTGLNVVLIERETLIEAYKDVISLEITEENLNTFKELRLMIVKNRTQGINKWHKSSKEFFLAGGRFVDAIKNKENAINEEMESKLLAAEKHFENLEKERVEKLQKERVSLVSEYIEDAHLVNLSSMEADVWESYLSTKKKAYLDAKQAELDAEKERLAKEKAEQEAIEKQRLENAKLKKEADKREKEILAERKAQADLLAKQKAESEAKELATKKENERLAKIETDKRNKIESERLAKEKKAKETYEAKIKKQEEELKAIKDAELKAKKDAELKAIQEKKDAELKAKAPIKKQLNDWVNDFNIENINIENEKKDLIISKFESFKKWAKKQIETI